MSKTQKYKYINTGRNWNTSIPHLVTRNTWLFYRFKEVHDLVADPVLRDEHDRVSRLATCILPHTDFRKTHGFKYVFDTELEMLIDIQLVPKADLKTESTPTERYSSVLNIEWCIVNGNCPAGSQKVIRHAFRNYIFRDPDKYLVKSALENFFDDPSNFDLRKAKRSRARRQDAIVQSDSDCDEQPRGVPLSGML